MIERSIWTALLVLVFVSTSAAFATGGGGSSGGSSGSSTTSREYTDTVERKSGADARASNALKCFSVNGVINGGTFRASVEAKTSSFPIKSIYMQHNVRMYERIENRGDTYLGRSETITQDERGDMSRYFRSLRNAEYDREFGCYRFNPFSAVLDGLLARSYHKAIATNNEGGHRYEFYDQDYDRFN